MIDEVITGKQVTLRPVKSADEAKLSEIFSDPEVARWWGEPAKSVRDAKGGRVEFRVDKTAVIHTVVGKASFSEQALVENLATVIEAINRARPAGVKGQYVRSAHLTSTQGPSVKLDLGATLGLGGRATA